MSRSPLKASGPTELSQLLIESRRRADLRQNALEKLIGLPDQYVSKVERGAIRRPKPPMLNKLAGFLKRDVRELLEAGRRTADGLAVGVASEGQRFRIITGHTVWAAPALLALRHRDFSVFEFASSGSGDSPRWLRGGDADPSPVETRAPGEQEHTYSAKDVGDHLRNGRGDFGLLPRTHGSVLSDGELQPIMDLMDSPSACLVSLPASLWDKRETKPTHISISNVADLMGKVCISRSKDKPKIRIIAEAGTIAEHHERALAKRLGDSGLQLERPPPGVRSSEFEKFEENYGPTGDYDVIIGWNPPMEWFHRSMKKKANPRHLAHLRSDDPETRVRMAFVAAKSRLIERRIDPPVALLWRFVEEVEKASTIVQNIVENKDIWEHDHAGVHRDAARFLVSFFRLGTGAIDTDPITLSSLLGNTLGELNFCSRPSVEFFGPFVRRALG